MRITDPVLAPDVSSWCDHIKSNEFQDGGCGSIVVGMYAVIDSTGKKVLSPISRKQFVDVVTNSSLVLQAYYWDDITQDPNQQAEWVVETFQKEGFPIKWIWADQEQWWTDWTAWQQAKGGKIPWSQVPIGSPAVLSAHYQKFINALHVAFPQSGVYTNKGFVSTWAPAMDNWLSQFRSWVPQYGRQPKEAVAMTWADLKEKWMPDYDIVLSSGQLPELVMGHQFTGDMCYLPGSYNQYDGVLPNYDGRLPLDVSVFSKAFIDAINANSLNPVPITPVPTPDPGSPVDYVVVPTRINVRALPSGDATWVRYAEKDEVLHVVNISGGWAELTDGTYVYAAYIAIKPSDTPVPPTPIPTPTPVPPEAVEYLVVPARINVRAQPSGDATWVRYAVKDEVLQVVSIANGWAELLDGTYVFADYIVIKPGSTPITPPAPTPTPEPPTPTPTPPPAPTPTPPATTDYVVVPARINVRSQPSSTSTWVRYADKGEVLHVVSIANGWAQLLDGTYVFADYIALNSSDSPVPPTPNPTPPATDDYVVLYARINVRAKPTSDSTWVRFAVKDEVLHVVNIANGWAKLSDGTYVFAEYIKKV